MLYSSAMRDDEEDEIRELRRERNLLRALIDSTPMLFVAIDADGRTRLMNPAMLAALGYEEHQVLGMDYLQMIVHPDDRAELRKVFDRIVKERHHTLSENRILTREGGTILVEWHGAPVFDERGEFEFFFGIGTDITERRHRDQLLAEKEARRRATFALARDAIVIAADSGEILDANGPARSLLGYDDREIQQKTAADLRLPTAVGRERATEGATLRAKDGTAIPVEVDHESFHAGERRLYAYRIRPSGKTGNPVNPHSASSDSLPEG